MGYATKRKDGTYRSWSAYDQSDALQPGEVYEQHATMPTLTPPAGYVDPRADASAKLDTASQGSLKDVQAALDALRTVLGL